MIRSCSALAVALLLMAGACSSSDNASQALAGTKYWSTSVISDGEPLALVGETRITLEFTDGVLSANAGCNSIGGDFSIEDGELRAGNLSMTGMGCDPERHDQDAFLIDVLGSAPTVTIDGDTLQLATSTAVINLIDADIANPDLAFVGTTWEIDGFLSGQTASAFATPVKATVRIDDAIMELFDGCSTVTLPVEIDGAEIRFEPVGVPAAENCEAPAGYRQSIYTALSRGALEYAVDGTALTMATPDNVGFTLKAVE